jgi:hypothetical protein
MEDNTQRLLQLRRTLVAMNETKILVMVRVGGYLYTMKVCRTSPSGDKSIFHALEWCLIEKLSDGFLKG